MHWVYKIVTQLSLIPRLSPCKILHAKLGGSLETRLACEILVRKASYNGLLCLLYLLGICYELPVCCIDAINHIMNYVQLSHDAINRSGFDFH